MNRAERKRADKVFDYVVLLGAVIFLLMVIYGWFKDTGVMPVIDQFLKEMGELCPFI
jgi:hypothetical protein